MAGPSGGPVRTCIGCRERRPQADLIRVVRRSDGALAVGRHQPGRGAWLCAGRPLCRDLAVRRNAFARALRGPVGDLGALDLVETAPRR